MRKKNTPSRSSHEKKQKKNRGKNNKQNPLKIKKLESTECRLQHVCPRVHRLHEKKWLRGTAAEDTSQGILFALCLSLSLLDLDQKGKRDEGESFSYFFFARFKKLRKTKLVCVTIGGAGGSRGKKARKWIHKYIFNPWLSLFLLHHTRIVGL